MATRRDLVVAIARVKDEQDIIARTAGRMVEQCDHLLIADNQSTDGTRDLLADLQREHPNRVTVVDDPEVGYFQARQMTELAARAAEMGAEWVVPFDADEWWSSPIETIAYVLRRERGASIVTAELYDHVATGNDPDEPDPINRIGWRRIQAGALPKVACRARAAVSIHQGNHGADFGATIPGLQIRHFPYRSVEQFVSKVRNGAAAYAATDLPEHQGKHWRDYGQLLEAGGPDALGDVFRAWFWTATPTLDHSLTFDPVQR